MPALTLSVVIPNYNHGHFLRNLLESILRQSYQPLEIIVGDDASTDNSVEIIGEFVDRDPRVKLIQNENNLGVAKNLNNLLHIASGDYLLALAADDKILPGFLEQSMCLLARYPQAGLCSTASWIMDESGSYTSLATTLPLINMDAGYISPQAALYLLQDHGSWISGNATIYRRQALIEADGFIPELGSYTDGFVQEVLALRHGVCYIREPLAAWRLTTTNYSVTISTDSERELAILAHAVDLMNTKYREIFPPEYIEVAINRWLRRYSMLNWQKLLADQKLFLTNTAKRFEFSGISWFNHFILASIKLLMLIQDMTVKVLLSLRFGIPQGRLPSGVQNIYRLYNTKKLKKMES